MSDATGHRQVRLAQNQSLFRSVKERVEKLAERFTTEEPLGFVCECADQVCGSRLELEVDECEAIRQEPMHFLVLPGHVYPEAEIIIEARDAYVIVKKIGAAGRVAVATDARQTSRMTTF